MTPVKTYYHPYRCLKVYAAHTHRPLCSSRSWPGSHTWRVRLGHRVEPHQPDVDQAGPTCARWLLPQHSLAIPRCTPTGQPGLVHQNAPEREGKQFKCVFIWCICTKVFVICDTDRHFEADGIGWYKHACSEGCEVPGATNSPAGIGFCQGNHSVCPPLLLTLTEVLTQRGKHPDLKMDTHRLRARAAGRAHVYEVVQSGVVRPVWQRGI